MKKLLILFILISSCKKEDAPQPKQSQSSGNTIKLVISSPTSNNVVGAYYNPTKTYFVKEVGYNLNAGDSLIAYCVAEIKTLIDGSGNPYSWYSDEVQIDYYLNGTLKETIKGNGVWLNYQSDFKLWLRRKI